VVKQTEQSRRSSEAPLACKTSRGSVVGQWWSIFALMNGADFHSKGPLFLAGSIYLVAWYPILCLRQQQQITCIVQSS